MVYIPEAKANLFSISKVEYAGMRVVFEGGRVEILRDLVVVATGRRRDKLYELDFNTPKGMCDSLLFSGEIDKANELWHQRYGHLGERNLTSLLKGEMVEGMKAVQGEERLVICEPCAAAKQTRNPLRCIRKGDRVECWSWSTQIFAGPSHLQAGAERNTSSHLLTTGRGLQWCI